MKITNLLFWALIFALIFAPSYGIGNEANKIKKVSKTTIKQDDKIKIKYPTKSIIYDFIDLGNMYLPCFLCDYASYSYIYNVNITDTLANFRNNRWFNKPYNDKLLNSDRVNLPYGIK